MTPPKGNEYRFTYDDLGRLTRAEDPSAGSSALASAAVENGQEVTLTTAMGRASVYRNEILSSGDRRWVSIFPGFDKFQWKLGNDSLLGCGDYSGSGPDGFGTVGNYCVAYSGGKVYPVQYTRDKLGRIIGKIETILGVTESHDYAYDPADRLSEVKKNGITSAQYVYDGNGNRLSYSNTVNTLTGVYDGQDRLTQYGNAAFAYTAKGELENKTVGSQTDSYPYDALGNLTRVILFDGTQIEHVVDGRNRRVGKKTTEREISVFSFSKEPIAIKISHRFRMRLRSAGVKKYIFVSYCPQKQTRVSTKTLKPLPLLVSCGRIKLLIT